MICTQKRLWAADDREPMMNANRWRLWTADDREPMMNVNRWWTWTDDNREPLTTVNHWRPWTADDREPLTNVNHWLLNQFAAEKLSFTWSLGHSLLEARASCLLHCQNLIKITWAGPRHPVDLTISFDCYLVCVKAFHKRIHYKPECRQPRQDWTNQLHANIPRLEKIFSSHQLGFSSKRNLYLH